MNNSTFKEYSNQSLLLIVSHEDVFDKETVSQAKSEWETRDLNQLEIEALIRIQEDAIDTSQNLSNKSKNEINIVPVLVKYDIDESIAITFSKSLKPKKYMTTIGAIIFIFFLLRLLFKFT